MTNEYFEQNIAECERKIANKEPLSEDERLHYIIRPGRKPTPRKGYKNGLRASIGVKILKEANNIHHLHFGWYKCPICGYYHIFKK